MVAAIATAVLELIDAFTIDVPVAAIVAAVLFLIGAWWLTRPGLASVIYTGILSLLELVLVLFAFGGIEALTSPNAVSEFLHIAAFAVATGVGVIATAVLLTSQRA